MGMTLIFRLPPSDCHPEHIECSCLSFLQSFQIISRIVSHDGSIHVKSAGLTIWHCANSCFFIALCKDYSLMALKLYTIAKISDTQALQAFYRYLNGINILCKYLD